MVKLKIKTRQIAVLEDKILKNGLLIPEILEIAKSIYNDNPYHNYLHALRVTDYTMLLIGKFTPFEVRSLMIAALLHDAKHTGTPDDLDEFVALDEYRKTMDIIQEKYPDFIVDDSICRNAIIGTVFKKRPTNTNIYAKIMADLDIGDIGAGAGNLIYYGSGLAYEFGVSPREFYEKTEANYFKFLMSIDKQIFRTQEIRDALNSPLKTIKEFYTIPIDAKLDMFETLKNQDITLEEFKTKYKEYFT